jgi:hypothetical protein
VVNRTCRVTIMYCRVTDVPCDYNVLLHSLTIDPARKQGNKGLQYTRLLLFCFPNSRKVAVKAVSEAEVQQQEYEMQNPEWPCKQASPATHMYARTSEAVSWARVHPSTAQCGC